MCGVVKLAEVVDPAVVADMKAHDAVIGFEAQGESESIEHASRGTDRYEVRVPLGPPFTDAASSLPLVVAAKLLLQSRKIEVDTLSHVTSMPGAPAQHWHADVSHLFKTSKQSAAQGIVIVLPLVPLNPAVGPTECLGSHLRMAQEKDEFWHLCDDEAKRPTKTAAIAAETGDVVLFDVRIRHRGGPNTKREKRPILYVGMVKDW